MLKYITEISFVLELKCINKSPFVKIYEHNCFLSRENDTLPPALCHREKVLEKMVPFCQVKMIHQYLSLVQEKMFCKPPTRKFFVTMATFHSLTWVLCEEEKCLDTIYPFLTGKMMFLLSNWKMIYTKESCYIIRKVNFF